MKRLIFRRAFLVGGIIIGLGLPDSIRAQVPGYVTKRIFKTDLVNLPGQEAIIYASEWSSGFRLSPVPQKIATALNSSTSASGPVARASALAAHCMVRSPLKTTNQPEQILPLPRVNWLSRAST